MRSPNGGEPLTGLPDADLKVIVRLVNCKPGQKRRFRNLHRRRSLTKPTLKPGITELTRECIVSGAPAIINCCSLSCIMNVAKFMPNWNPKWKSLSSTYGLFIPPCAEVLQVIILSAKTMNNRCIFKSSMLKSRCLLCCCRCQLRRPFLRGSNGVVCCFRSYR